MKPSLGNRYAGILIWNMGANQALLLEENVTRAYTYAWNPGVRNHTHCISTNLRETFRGTLICRRSEVESLVNRSMKCTVWNYFVGLDV